MHRAAQFFHHDAHVGHIAREAAGVFRGEQTGDAQVCQRLPDLRRGGYRFAPSAAGEAGAALVFQEAPHGGAERFLLWRVMGVHGVVSAVRPWVSPVRGGR